MGKTRLSWNQGPALSFADISIGPTTDQTLQISAKHLLLRLDLRALRQKQIKFTEIVLLGPRMVLQLTEKSRVDDLATTGISPSEIPLGKIFVHDLSLRKGSLLILKQREQRSKPLEITDINARLSYNFV